MKATGIVRKLDELGRITLPIELRRTLDVTERDPLEIFVDDDAIILKKYDVNASVCKHCGGTMHLKKVGSSYICRNCAVDAYNATREV
ncbi:MAG: AbrB family transcriptional regulator [Clostridiales bacterium]|jgi:transcriptional pleiotropic regulator of transition state genes|nr:AbrB family transcriptional regulator [Clostridiales bacterium]